MHFRSDLINSIGKCTPSDDFFDPVHLIVHFPSKSSQNINLFSPGLSGFRENLQYFSRKCIGGCTLKFFPLRVNYVPLRVNNKIYAHNFINYSKMSQRWYKTTQMMINNRSIVSSCWIGDDSNNKWQGYYSNKDKIFSLLFIVTIPVLCKALTSTAAMY